MQNIPISLAAAGMVIAREIKSSSESSAGILCGKGVKLTESLLNRLRQLGVESMTVEGHPVKMEGEASVQQMLEALDQRFRRVANDPLMMKVKQMYRRQILRSMGEAGGE
jgi:hypothetical protein